MKRLFVISLMSVLLLLGLTIYGQRFLLSDSAENDMPQVAEVDIMPRKYWNIEAYMFPQKEEFHYTLRLTSHPYIPINWTVRPHDLKLEVLDYKTNRLQKNLTLVLAPDMPDILTTYPEADTSGRKTGGLEAKLGLRLDRGTAAPGMYKIRVKGNVEAVERNSGKAVKLPDFGSLLSIYLPPLPDKLLSLEPGQRFLAVPWSSVDASKTTEYQDSANGKSLTYGQIAARTFKLIKVERPEGKKPVLFFELEEYPHQVKLESDAAVTKLPYITPIVEDQATKKLQAEYNGKKVWPYAGPGMCISTRANEYISPAMAVDDPIVLRRVERVYQPVHELSIGTAPGYMGERESSFITMNPLVVILDTPSKGLEMGGAMYTGEVSEEEMAKAHEQLEKNPKDRCIAIWNIASDRWDFERSYSLKSAFQQHPEWTSKMRKQVMNGEYAKGTTKAMLVWIMGWPSIYGTKDEILKLNTWTYDSTPPFSNTYKFQNGKIVSIDEPRLP